MVVIKIAGLGSNNVIETVLNINNDERMLKVYLDDLSYANQCKIAAILNNHLDNMGMTALINSLANN
ncbi:hypothetical protein UFOVP22_48 [uncultured Caudovirales phage]|uniref:Uncharacterized protein n=1 Tax=uncultured Caudovirales phage TaxID=2100421 RepID=A0A6J5T859_9CAUD|nr:hypothetical protein UFOVP22_48 [uncultured Caudovirales phage]